MSEKMREALIAYIAAGVGNSTDYEKQTDALRLAMDALAEQPAQGEAVAPSVPDDVRNCLTEARDIAMRHALEARIPECGHFGAIAQDLDYVCGRMLDTTPEAPAPSVSEGWKQVPVEPTAASIYAGVAAYEEEGGERLPNADGHDMYVSRAMYRAMLAAAPAPPAPSVPDEQKLMRDSGPADAGFVRGWNACRAVMLAAAPEPRS